MTYTINMLVKTLSMVAIISLVATRTKLVASAHPLAQALGHGGYSVRC